MVWIESSVSMRSIDQPMSENRLKHAENGALWASSTTIMLLVRSIPRASRADFCRSNVYGRVTSYAPQA